MGIYQGEGVYNAGISEEEVEELIAANGKGLFLAEYGVTSYDDISSAFDEGKIVICKYVTNDDYIIYAPFTFKGTTEGGQLPFYFEIMDRRETNRKIVLSIGNNNQWTNSTAQIAAVDQALDTTSVNPVENKAIALKLNEIDDKITGDLNDIFLALASKGVTVPPGAGLDDVAGYIGEIPLYIFEGLPDDNVGKEGENSFVNSRVVVGDNGTIIPVQSDNTNCFGNLGNQNYYKLFDGDYSTSSAISVPEKPSIFGYDFGENDKKSIISVSLLNYENQYQYHSTIGVVVIQASNDKITWEDLAYAKCPDYSSTNWVTIFFSNTKLYRYYRVYIQSYNSQNFVIEIHMNDTITIDSGVKQTLTFRKRCDRWAVLDNDMIYIRGWANRVKALYRTTGGTSTSFNITYNNGQYNSNSTVTIEGYIDPTIIFPQSQYDGYLFGCWWSSARPKLAIYCMKRTAIDYVEKLEFFISNNSDMISGGGIGQYSLIIDYDTFINANKYKFVINANNAELYLDDQLAGTKVLDGYTQAYHDINELNLLGQAPGSLNYSPQIGISRVKAIDNDDGHVEFDFMAAKDPINGAVGWVERVLNIFYTEGGGATEMT